MVYVCCVDWCLLKSKCYLGVRLHRFPKDSAICTKWVAAVANTREDGIFNLMHNHRICTRHFDEQYWIKKRNGEILRLRPEAIPTIFNKDRHLLLNKNSVMIKEPNVKIAKPSTLLHPDGIHRFDCQTFQCNGYTELKCNAISKSDEWSYEKKRRLYSYACQFSEQDLEIPHKRKLFWNAFHVMRQDNLMRVKCMEKQKQRTQIKINTLNKLIDSLRNNDQNDYYTDSIKVIDIGLQASV